MNPTPSPRPTPPNVGEGVRLVRHSLGEGGKTGEGDSNQFMVPMRAQKRMEAAHERPR